MLSTTFTISEIAVVGTLLFTIITFIILYSRNKRLQLSQISKTETETVKLKTDLEIQFTDKMTQWRRELEALGETNDKKFKEKDEEILKLNHLILQSVNTEHACRAFHRLMAKTDTPYFEADSKGNYTFVNGEFCQVYGITEDQLLDDAWTLSIVENPAKILLQWKSLIKDEEIEDLFFTIVSELDGTKLRIIKIYSFIYNEKGELVKVIGTIIPKKVK